MKNIIITGTGGIVDNTILNTCLQNSNEHIVTSITRKPLGIKHHKSKEVIHADFLD